MNSCPILLIILSDGSEHCNILTYAPSYMNCPRIEEFDSCYSLFVKLVLCTYKCFVYNMIFMVVLDYIKQWVLPNDEGFIVVEEV